MTDLCRITDTMVQKKVSLVSLKEPIDLTNTTATGIFTAGLFKLMAEFERNIIKERQKEGIQAAIARGKKWGTPKKYGLDQRVVENALTDYYFGRITKEQAMEIVGGSRATFYNRYTKWRKENGYDGHAAPLVAADDEYEGHDLD